MKLTYVARAMTLPSISLAVSMIACQPKPPRVGDSAKPVESAAAVASTEASAAAAPSGRSVESARVDSAPAELTTRSSAPRRAPESTKQSAPPPPPPPVKVARSEDGAGSTTRAAAPEPLAPRPALSPISSTPDTGRTPPRPDTPALPPTPVASATPPSAAPAPHSQERATPERATPSVEEALARLPFSTGELLEFQVKFGSLSVGSARLEVVGLETVRGVPTVHTIFSVRGGVPFYRVNDRYESWFDPRDLSVLRAVQNVDQGPYERDRHFEIYPESKTFTENDKPAEPSVAGALDEGAFIFLVRTMPLEPGQTYEFSRYFRPDRNPVKIQVSRRERVKVPAGEFQTVVVQPTIKARGIFSEGGRAEVWFSDDSSRAVVQLKTKMKVGSLSLLLKGRRPGGAWGEIPK
jgi:Protein of unknown function (DUF3108)